jgi:hypothetical protein
MTIESCKMGKMDKMGKIGRMCKLQEIPQASRLIQTANSFYY